jgi:polysaccharide biosynthesis transport protein
MDISIRDFLKLLTKNLLFIVLCAIIGLSGAFCITKFIVKPTYISSVKLYVYTKGDIANTPNYNNLNDLNYAQKIVNTYIEMLRTDSFYKSVSDKSLLRYSIDDLKTMINFSVLNDTEVFQVSVLSHNPEESKKIADIITELAPQTISSIQDSALLKVVDPANLPSNSSSPNVPLDSMIGFLLGIIAAILYILLKDMLDVRIKQEDDLSSRYNIPILGSIPEFEFHSIKGGKKDNET